MGFITHDLNGKARGAIALVVGGVCVVIGKVEVGHGQCECRKPSYNYCGAGAEGLG